METKKATAGSATKGKNAAAPGNGSLLRDFFVESLKDIYYAEKHLVKALGTLQKASTNEDLRSAFEDHQSVTENHVTRLEKAFELLGMKPTAKKCEAIEGITKEAKSIIDETETDTITRDAALIMAAQKAEHYEIATYGTLVQLANTLKLDEISSLLNQTLQEEKEADETLTGIAESHINVEASQE